MIKEKLNNLQISVLEKETTLSGCKLLLNKNEIGGLQLAYVSSKVAGWGSLFGVYAECWVSGGEISSIIEQLELSYPKFGQMEYYFSHASVSETDKIPLSRRFDRQGIVTISENVNLDEKCNYIIEKLNTIYIPKILNFTLGNMEVIDDIVESPMDYAYPMASIIVTCFLNRKMDNVEQIIKEVKSKKNKLYDAGNERIKEVIGKLRC